MLDLSELGLELRVKVEALIAFSWVYVHDLQPIVSLGEDVSQDPIIGPVPDSESVSSLLIL